MQFLIQNSILTKNSEKTYLTSAASSAGTTLSVKGFDLNLIADNDYLIIGSFGSDTAELMQVNGTPSSVSSLTIDRSGGAGGLRSAHSIDESVFRIAYNKVLVYHASTETGTKTLVATVDLQPGTFNTVYEDSTNTTGFGFVRFYNSTLNQYSEYSDAIPYSGQSDRSLQEIREMIKSFLDLTERDEEYVTDEVIDRMINRYNKDIINERFWTFNEIERTLSSVENAVKYTKPSDLKDIYSVRFKTKPIHFVSENEWDITHWESDQSSSEPTKTGVWNDSVRFFPRSDSSASTTTLDGAVTSSATTITVVSTADFKRGDYYRFLIDSEVIYATGATSTTFTGCSRGEEETTASSHTTASTVTERDIVLMGQRTAQTMVEINDETIVPEPSLIAFGVTSELAYSKLKDKGLGDRYEIKYKDGLKALRSRWTKKFSGQFQTIKRVEQTVHSFRTNQNDYPSNVTDI